jgi:hypothetical protein
MKVVQNFGDLTTEQTKLTGLTNEILGNVTSTKVVCKDGTIKYQQSSPNARYGDACVNNGGRAENQPVENAPKNEVAYSSVNLSPEEKFYESLGLKNKRGLTLPLKSKGRLLVAVVLVAGYFAYKKFKK